MLHNALDCLSFGLYTLAVFFYCLCFLEVVRAITFDVQPAGWTVKLSCPAGFQWSGSGRLVDGEGNKADQMCFD